MISIRCGFDKQNYCAGITETPRVIANIFGILFNAFFFYIHFIYLSTDFPMNEIPWAKPLSKFDLIKRLLLLVSTIIIVFIDFWTRSIEFFVMLIPLFVIQSFQIWILVLNRVSYNDIVEAGNIFVDSLLWSMLFYSGAIEIVNDTSDASYCILVAITTTLLTIIIFFYKKQIQNDKLPKVKQLSKLEDCQLSILITVLQYAQFEEGTYEDLQLKQLYHQHKWICQDSTCPCSEQQKLIISGILEETLLQNEDDQYYVDPYMKQLLNNDEDDNNEVMDEFSDIQRRKRNKFSRIKSIQVRNKFIIKILIHYFKSVFTFKNVQLLEIFIKSYYYKSVHSSCYDLAQIKQKCQSTREKYYYQFLRILIFQLTKEIEEESKKDIFNIDSAIQVDRYFSEYKRSVNDITIMVDRFWSSLNTQNYFMLEMIELGKNIVDTYLTIKDIYDKILTEKPDHREVIMLNISFNQNVMNFELEVISMTAQLKNIDQKIKISRQNQYKQAKNDLGIIIVHYTHNKKSKINITNKKIQELTGYLHSELMKKDLNYLLPQIVASQHDRIIDKYLKSDHSRFLHSELKRVWIKHIEGYIKPVNVQIQTCLSQEKGLMIVGFVDEIEQIQTSTYFCKTKETTIILANDQGFLVNGNQKFIENYMNSNIASFEETKISLEDLIVNYKEFSLEDLKNGVKTQVLLNLGVLSNFNQNFQSKKVQDALVIVNKYETQYNLTINEVIVIEEQNSQLYKRMTNMVTKTLNREDQEKSVGDLEEEEKETEENNNRIMQRIVGPQGSDSGSSNSSSTTSGADSFHQKGIIDFHSMPQSVSNLKRAIMLFFLTIIATSFALLGVCLVSNNQFYQDRIQVYNSIQLMGELANIRLAFKMMLLTPNLNKTSIAMPLSELQDKLEYYYDAIRDYATEVLSDQYIDSNKLSNDIRNNVLEIFELQTDGSVKSYNTTFSIGFYQYLSKMEQFIHLSESEFLSNFKAFKITNIMKNYSNYWKDAWYLITNGNMNIRSYSQIIADDSIEQGEGKESNYTLSVLIISTSCIAITVVASLILIPFTFSLDNEEKNAASKWTQISKPTIEKVIQNINEFSSLMMQERVIHPDHQRKNNIYRESGMNSISNNISQLDFGSVAYSDNQIRFEDESRDMDRSQNILIKSVKLKVDSDKEIKDGRSDKANPQEKLASINQVQLEFNTQTNHQTNNFQTTQVDKSMMNDSSDDLVSQSKNAEIMNHQLVKIYFVQKIQKAILILSFSLIIIGFYIASYLITNSLFQSASGSFQFYEIASRRGPCSASSFTFLLEQFSQNKTIHIGMEDYNLYDYIMHSCQNYESSFLEYQKNPPDQLESIKDEFRVVDSDNGCSKIFSGNQLQECQNYMNGLLQKGLRNAYQKIYYYQLNEYVSFDAQAGPNRTQAYLDKHQYSSDTQSYLKLVLEYMIPMTNYLSQQIDQSIQQYLDKKLKLFIILFIIFVIFLIGCLIMALRLVVQFYKKVVLRSRILIKIVPIDELTKIFMQKQGITKGFRKKIKHQ